MSDVASMFSTDPSCSPKLGSTQVLVIEGFESVSLLIYKFPLPFPGSHAGAFAMYETAAGHAWKFLEAAQGASLSAKIYTADGQPLYSLQGVTVRDTTAACDWTAEAEEQALTIKGAMFWQRAELIASSKPAPEGGLATLLQVQAG